MTDTELVQLCVLMDQLWGGVDEGREAGYRYALSDIAEEDVVAAVRQLATEDRPFLPKPPEVAVRALRFQRERRNRERIERRLDELAAMDRAAVPEATE